MAPKSQKRPRPRMLCQDLPEYQLSDVDRAIVALAEASDAREEEMANLASAKEDAEAYCSQTILERDEEVQELTNKLEAADFKILQLELELVRAHDKIKQLEGQKSSTSGASSTSATAMIEDKKVENL